MVDTAKLKPTEFNPGVRTEGKRLTELMEVICEARCILQPLLITRDYWIADGNRRHAAAKNLGIPAVPCIVSDLGLQLLFRLANSGRMHITNAQWSQILAKEFSIENLPPAQQKIVCKIREAISDDKDFCEVIQSGKSLKNVYTYGRALARLCGDDDLLGVAIVWIVRQPAIINIRQVATSTDVSPDRLRTEIISGKPLARTV